jgi:acyl-CoA reductase-like NAD-dependent aldehyde dehydrogenase
MPQPGRAEPTHPPSFSPIARSLFPLLPHSQPSVPLVVVDLSPGPLPSAKAATPDLKLASRPGLIQCYSPATMQLLGEVRAHTPDDVRAIVARGRALQPAWARTTFAERRAVLRMMVQVIRAQQDDIVRLSCIDTGKTRVDALFGEILASLGKLEWVIAEGEALLRPEARPTNFTSMHKRARVEYHPLGVVGVIAPWNYPFYNLYNHIASALFAGNAVVLKMSEYSAWSGDKYVRVARDVLRAAGYSPDLVQVVQGFGEAGAALVEATDKVIFTGSPGIGKMVMRGAAASLTPLVLELGGKDPLIICEDVALGSVLPIALRGTYQNAGQNCVGIERVYAYEGVHDAFVEAAAETVRKMRVGPSFDPVTGEFAEVDMGAITTAMQLNIIQELVDDAVAKGATVHVGGKILWGGGETAGSAAAPASAKKGRRKSVTSSAAAAASASAPAATSGGLFYAPTVISGVTHKMRIANEEVFGPVMAIFKVPGNSDDAAVAMANSTAYGLGATVFCGNPRRGDAIAARIRSGMVGVNAYGLNYLVQSLPFGGVGISGFARFSGAEGLRECCLTKSVVTDILPFLSVPTPVPAPLRYPLPKSSPGFVGALLDLQFAPTLAGRIKGLVGVATA